ncbi:MAG: T9SS type A sorting domain-containing protein, partial [Sphingomonadales bacterium]
VNSQSTTLVISQVYGGGGATTGSATYQFDYIELYNRSSTSQSLNGLSLVYGSATGLFASSSSNAFALPNVSIPSGGYYLIQCGGAGTVGSTFPVTSDATTPGSNMSLSSTNGKVALVVTASFTTNSCGGTLTPCTLPSPAIIDLVSYGGSSTNAEGGAPVGNLSTIAGAVRKSNGQQDTDNNLNDFNVVTAPVPRNSGSPLPVTFTSFSATKDGKNNLLSWSTAAEQNNAGFEVQRSTDGTTYENIGFVKSLSATGNSSTPLSYTFTDFSPLGLQQYYRLKQTDLDGKFAYSAIVLVKREAPATLTVTKVYPNPSTSSIYINAACPAATTLQLAVVDMNGRVVGRKQVNALVGNNGFDMPVAQLAPGTYLLQVINANNKVVTTEKFIKQ